MTMDKKYVGTLNFYIHRQRKRYNSMSVASFLSATYNLEIVGSTNIYKPIVLLNGILILFYNL